MDIFGVGHEFFFFFWDQTWKNFGWNFVVGHGNIFLLGMDFGWNKSLDMGKFLLSMGSSLFFCVFIFIFLVVGILEWVFYGHLDDWPTLFCITLRVKVATRCWKAYVRFCLRILRASLMKQASRLFSKPYWIRIVMSTKNSSYSLLCQSSLGTLCALSIFPALVKWC